MRRRRLISLFLLLAVVISTAGALVFAPARHARAAASEHISDYNVALTAQADGDLLVKETIAYDFGSNSRHGIYRYIPTTVSWSKTHNRVWQLDAIKVTQDGKKATVATQVNNDNEVIQVGDKDKAITGAHTYVITYTVAGAFLAGPTSTDLTWNAVGTEWSVPVDKAEVSITAPAAATPLTCAYGPTDSKRPCATSGTGYSVASLPANEGMTVTYGLPAGSIGNVGPILRHKVTAAWFFAGSKIGLGVGLAAMLAGVAAVILRWRRKGRDERFVGQIPGLAPVPGQATAVRTGGPDDVVSVSFIPPKGVRPAELAMLLNESADQRGVTATLIDLAVRRYLTIEEIESAKRKAPDHVLDRLDPPAGDQLAAYESDLLDGVFDSQPQIVLSEKKNDLAKVSSAAQRAIETRAVGFGWFVRKPSTTKARWRALGAVGMVLGVLAMVAGARWGWGTLGAGLVVVGLVCLVAAPRMPARTAAGSAIRADGLAFRRYLETAEADQIRAEEREEIFNRYLPFAIAFDLAGHWVSTFQQALAPVGGGSSSGAAPYAAWYVGTGGFGSFSSDLNSFSSGMSSAMTSASSSGGGGGGVGGGGGGGGGGSW